MGLTLGWLAEQYFPLVAYYAERPSNPDLAPAAEWLARRGRREATRAAPPLA